MTSLRCDITEKSFFELCIMRATSVVFTIGLSCATHRDISCAHVHVVHDPWVGTVCHHAGSGKSYTMMGAGNDDHLKGIIPRLCDVLFERIAEVWYRHVYDHACAFVF